jgi:hypothetical protein
MGDLAYAFRFQPSEIDAMTVDELYAWHKQAIRIYGDGKTT